MQGLPNNGALLPQGNYGQPNQYGQSPNQMGAGLNAYNGGGMQPNPLLPNANINMMGGQTNENNNYHFRFKIAIVGDSGVGKSTFLDAISQTLGSVVENEESSELHIKVSLPQQQFLLNALKFRQLSTSTTLISIRSSTSTCLGKSATTSMCINTSMAQQLSSICSMSPRDQLSRGLNSGSPSAKGLARSLSRSWWETKLISCSRKATKAARAAVKTRSRFR